MKRNKTINAINTAYPNHNLFNKDGSINYNHPYYHQFDDVDFEKAPKPKKASAFSNDGGKTWQEIK